MKVRVLRAVAAACVATVPLVAGVSLTAHADEELLHHDCVLLVTERPGQYAGECYEAFHDTTLAVGDEISTSVRIVICSVETTSPDKVSCRGREIIQEMTVNRTGFDQGTGPTVTPTTTTRFVPGACISSIGVCAGGQNVEVPILNVDPSDIGDVYVNGIKVLDL